MENNGNVKTVQIYYEQPYLTDLEATITRIEEKGAQHIVELDRTIFYPEGGGQPSDQGEIVGAAGRLKVEQVRTLPDGRIVHQGKILGPLSEGEGVKLSIKWSARYKNMRVHSAGHLIHDVLMRLTDHTVTPTKGNHGPKAFLEYAGHLDSAAKKQLEIQLNEAVSQDLTIVNRDADYEEIASRCRFVPPGLPKNKQLRIIQIGSFDPMPDGGVQVRSTKEIGNVIIHSITEDGSNTVIRYGVKGGD
jgi:alanyl-tRNA synthetase